MKRVVLDTNDQTADGRLNAAQIDWLTTTLSASAARFKIVAMHKSVFSSGSHAADEEIAALNAQLVPIFNQHGVAMVLGGLSRRV